MKKVKVDEKTFNELEAILDKYGRERSDKSLIINFFVESKLTKDGQNLHSTSFIDFAEMMVNGYELEETKEQRLVEKFKSYSKEDSVFNSSSYVAGRKTGILECLEILQIKIKGIN